MRAFTLYIFAPAMVILLGLAVFDRGADFEPALDPIVRNDARRLRIKLLECRTADGVRIDVPKGGYTPVFLPAPHHRAAPCVPVSRSHCC